MWAIIFIISLALMTFFGVLMALDKLREGEETSLSSARFDETWIFVKILFGVSTLALIISHHHFPAKFRLSEKHFMVAFLVYGAVVYLLTLRYYTKSQKKPISKSDNKPAPPVTEEQQVLFLKFKAMMFRNTLNIYAFAISGALFSVARFGSRQQLITISPLILLEIWLIIFVGSILYFFWNFRCPNCRTKLKLNKDKKTCSRCNSKLRE